MRERRSFSGRRKLVQKINAITARNAQASAEENIVAIAFVGHP
jgi:hypothetical protein